MDVKPDMIVQTRENMTMKRKTFSEKRLKCDEVVKECIKRQSLFPQAKAKMYLKAKKTQIEFTENNTGMPIQIVRDS